jgi:hypothetical protein
LTAAGAAGWRWYGVLSAGVFPTLVIGFIASALANRLVFLGWGVAAAVGYALLLRRGWERGRHPGAVVAPALFWLAGAAALFGALAARHGESLDLGYRALLWPVHHPAVARPSTSFACAAVLAIAAAGLAATWRRSS